MLIYRPSDLIPVEFSCGDESFTLYFSPLSVAQKSQILASYQADQSPESQMMFVRKCLSSTLKKASGLTLADGAEWQPDFDDGAISAQSFDDLMSLPVADKVFTVGSMFLRSIPRGDRIVGLDGKELEGVVVKKSQQG